MSEVRSTLPPAAAGAAQARTVVRHALRRWGLQGVEDVVCLLVSELVANAVLHARGASEMVMRCEEGQLRVSVTDEDDRLPARHRRPVTSTTGRGFLLMDALASDWGSELDPNGPGKVVWFELDVSAEEPEHGERPAHDEGPDSSAGVPAGRGEK